MPSSGPPEDESGPAAAAEEEEPRRAGSVEGSPKEKSSPRASPGSPASGSSDDSTSSDDEDEHRGALRKLRSSVAQIKVSEDERWLYWHYMWLQTPIRVNWGCLLHTIGLREGTSTGETHIYLGREEGLMYRNNMRKEHFCCYSSAARNIVRYRLWFWSSPDSQQPFLALLVVVSKLLPGLMTTCVYLIKILWCKSSFFGD